MPIEDPNTVDIITKGKDGWLELIVTDSGQSGSPAARQRLLGPKLATYARYIASPDFLTENRLENLSQVRIRVLHSGPLYPQPLQSVTLPAAAACEIPVVFQQTPF